MIPKPFRDKIKERVVQDFFKANQRSPSAAELNELLANEETKYQGIEEVGFAGFNVERPNFRDTSSAAAENARRRAYWDDMLSVKDWISAVETVLEGRFRTNMASVERMRRKLGALERRIDTRLLLNRDNDFFIYSADEDFDTQDKVDISSSSNVEFESGFCTLGRAGYGVLDLHQVDIQSSVASEKGYVSVVSNGGVDDLAEDDGSYWEQQVVTTYRQGQISLTLTLDLGEAQYLGDVRVTVNPVDFNQQTTVTALYSLDGNTFVSVDPVERTITTDEIQISVGIDEVKKVRLVFSKAAYDKKTADGAQYLYVFSFDSIKLLTDGYTSGGTGTMVAGPYSVTDEEGTAVEFTKAVVDACVVIPDGTGVNFYLSNDGSTWTAIDYASSANNYVSFGDGTVGTSSSVVDSSADAYALIESIDAIDDYQFASEAFMNTYVDSSAVAQAPLSTTVVKRGVKYATAPTEILRAPPGWYKDGNLYVTTVYITDAAGRYFDLGGTSWVFNGTVVTGKVFVPQGYSVIGVYDDNFKEIASGITSLADLKAADPLYPLNHRYLIEGYDYPGSFTGDRVYSGVSEHFGRLLTYVPPEKFNTSTITDLYGIFTVEEYDGNRYFKMKVDKTDSSWSDEQASVSWMLQSSGSSDLYVKAILTTSDSSVSPTIEGYSVRVV